MLPVFCYCLICMHYDILPMSYHCLYRICMYYIYHTQGYTTYILPVFCDCLIPVTELNMKKAALMLVPKKHGERSKFLAPCTDVESGNEGYFFHFNSAISHKRVCFFGGPMLRCRP